MSRTRLSKDRVAIVHGFQIGQLDCALIVGFYDDATPGEIFLKIAKAGSTLRGLGDAFATAVSMTLQYGVPLQTLVDKFRETRFEPSGWVDGEEYSSILDYVFRYLARRIPTVLTAAAGIDPEPARLQTA